MENRCSIFVQERIHCTMIYTCLHTDDIHTYRHPNWQTDNCIHCTMIYTCLHTDDIHTYRQTIVYTAQWYIHVYIQTTYIHTDTQTDRQTIVYMYKKITLNLLRTELFIKQYRLKRSSTSSDSDKMKSYELSIHFISGYSYLSIYLYILY